MATMGTDTSRPMHTTLAEKMRILADGGTHERALELLARANDLDAAVYGRPPVEPKALLDAWRRAQRLWNDITGEEEVLGQVR